MSDTREHAPTVSPASAWHPLEPRIALTSLVVGLLGFCAWRTMATNGIFDDAPQLIEEFSQPGGVPLWSHVLYLPAAGLVRWFGATPDRALLLVSVLSGAVLLGCVHSAAFVVTGRRGPAMAATLAVALSPGVVHHATFIEVHALHAACVGAVLLALVASHARPRLVVLLAFVGAACTVLTHRSAALVAPALALVATAALQQRDPRNAVRRAAVATVLGTLFGYGTDEVVHRLIGGPPLLAAMLHVRGAFAEPSWAHALHELVIPLGALWFGALGGRGNTALRLAPLTALTCHGVPIVLAAIPTQGGYCLAAVPVLALGLAQQLAQARSRWPRLLFAGALLMSAWWAKNAATDPERAGFSALRERRIELVAACLPSGGTVFSLNPSRQHVTGARPGVREIDGFYWWWQLVLAGRPPATVHAQLRELLDQALQQPPVLLTTEWRDAPLPPPVPALLEELEQSLLNGLQRERVPGAPGRAWWVHR